MKDEHYWIKLLTTGDYSWGYFCAKLMQKFLNVDKTILQHDCFPLNNVLQPIKSTLTHIHYTVKA